MDATTTRAERYRQKAAEVRKLAEAMKDPEQKSLLLGVTKDYLYLADMLDSISGRSRGYPSSKVKPP
jgi:hypothetical protein